MTQVGAVPVVRVTVVGPAGRADLTVPTGAPVRDLLRPEVLGGRDPAGVTCRSPAGGLLDVDAAVADAGVPDGGVVVVTAGRAPVAGDSRSARRSSAGRRASAGRPARAGLLAGGLVALSGAAALASTGVVRPVAGLSLLALGVALALSGGSSRPGAAPVTAPAVAGAGTGVLVVADRPGWSLLAVTAAAAVAGVAAALARSGRLHATEPLAVWVALSSAAAAVGTLALATGLGPAGVAALVLGIVLPAVRLLPAGVVDVPDDVLLELDRLSVTAWSARETRGRRPRRVRLRRDDVSGTVEHGRRLLVAWAVAASLGTAVLAVVLTSTATQGWARWGTPVLLGCLAVGLPLAARALRESAPRVPLLLGGAACGATLAAIVLPGVTTVTAVPVVVVLVLGALSAAVAASAAGRGWRSVRWARVGDVLEGLAATLALPAALVAAGAVEWARQLVS